MINQNIDIDVDDTFNLKINNQIKANFNELFDTYKETFVNNDSLNKYNNDTFQSAVNCGDTIKDKVNQVTINQLGLFQPFKLQFTKDGLIDFIRLVKEKGIQKGISNRKHFTRNKASVVDSTITTQYITTTHHIAYDAGTSIQPFFRKPDDLQIFESIGKYLDPSKTRKSNFIFPEKGKTINISQNVFKRLGYDGNCNLNASANSPDNYNYEINIYGKNIIKNDKKDRTSDRNISQIFIGNKQKNELITKSKTKKEDKIALIIGKGWGDKLQVFIAFIYKLVNNNKITIGVSTGDAVVYNLCCYFGITCILISTTHDHLNDIKVDKILHYEPEMIDTKQFIKSLKKKFNEEKKKILEGYVAFLSLIAKIKNKNNQEITTGGTGDTYIFKKDFYDCIIKDLNGIKEKIEKLIVKEQNTIDSLNKSYEDLIQYNVNYFIKEITPGIFKITHTSANYNLTKITTGSGKPCFEEKYGKIKKNHSFFNIGEKYFLERKIKVGGTTPLENPPLENHLLKDSDYIYFMNDYNEDGTQKNFKVITKTSLLNQTLEDEKDEKDKIELEDEIEFDAIENLFKELKYLFDEYFDKDKYYFYDYWSDMMLRLESEPDYSTDTLIKYSKEILEEFKENTDVFEETTVNIEEVEVKPIVHKLNKHSQSNKRPRSIKVPTSNKRQRTINVPLLNMKLQHYGLGGGKRRRKSAKIYKKPKIYANNTTKKHK